MRRNDAPRLPPPSQGLKSSSGSSNGSFSGSARSRNRKPHGRARGWAIQPRDSPSWATDLVFRDRGRPETTRTRTRMDGRAPERTTAPLGDGPGVSRPGPATTRTRADGRASRRKLARQSRCAARASSSPRNDKNSREMKWGRQRRSPTISPRQRGENVASTRRQGSHQQLPSSRAGV